ncbi:MAG: ABC transporter permease [Acidimicrobiales bacterium]
MTVATAPLGRFGEHQENRGAPFPTATWIVARRALVKTIRTPQLLVAGTAQGVMFLLIFRYIFGGAIAHTGAMTYVDFVAPGFVVTSGLFGAMNGATAIAEDLQQGLVDRLRSLPIPAMSVIWGRVVADTVFAVWGLAVTTAVSFAVGFRLHGGIVGGLEAFGVAVLAAFAFCWLFATLGFYAGSAQGAQSLAFLVFPLTFVSSAYVPISTMPGWMQPFAAHQPITLLVNTARILTQGHAATAVLGHTAAFYFPTALVWVAGIVVVCGPLARWRLGRV